MLLRKINAGISLFITFLLLDHSIFLSVWMLSGGSFAKKANVIPFVLFGCMLVHAGISIAQAALGHKGAEKRKCNGYPKQNMATNLQRMSGMLLIVFTALHVGGTVGIMQPPAAVHAIVPPIFFAFALGHVAVSGSKAFITLGIGSAKFVKVADVVIKLVCAVTLVAAIVGFYLHSV